MENSSSELFCSGRKQKKKNKNKKKQTAIYLIIKWLYLLFICSYMKRNNIFNIL